MTIAGLREATVYLDDPALRKGEDQLRTFKLVRYMDMLGHGEYFHRPRPSALAAVPACFVKLPRLDRQSFLLCGMRSSASVDEIRAAAGALRIPIAISISGRNNLPDQLLPDRITIDLQGPDDAAHLANALNIKCETTPPAWTLACFSCDLDGFETSLQWRERTARDDELRFYDAESGSFISGSIANNGPSLVQLAEDASWTRLLRGDKEALVEDLDWARFWAHREAGISCLSYEGARRLLAVPARNPLPRLLARALCLCSGKPPIAATTGQKRAQQALSIYQDVPKEIAFKIADKLGSALVPKTISSIVGCDL